MCDTHVNKKHLHAFKVLSLEVNPYISPIFLCLNITFGYRTGDIGFVCFVS